LISSGTATDPSTTPPVVQKHKEDKPQIQISLSVFINPAIRYLQCSGVKIFC
jgi:hypothetical protein